MSKLYKLKDWFSLEDAARRLSSGLGEPVSSNDVLQLVIEGHIPLSWYARHVPAERVAKACMLLDILSGISAFEKDDGTREYVGPVWWHGDRAYRRHMSLKEVDALNPYASLEWTSIHGEQVVERIEGLFRLELNECGALKDWVHSQLTHTGGELITVDGFFVSDQEGVMWRILEYNPVGEYTLQDGKLKAPYHLGGEFPDPEELVVLRSDIEAFEARIAPGAQSPAVVMSPRERETLLNITGGLLGLLLGKTPAGKPQSVFESQVAVIDALLARYEGKAGIAKRTLEEKLALAKRIFTSS